MSNLRFAKDYALHRLKGKTRHGTHSPFVYRLVDKVIYDFSPKKVYDEVEALRRALLSDNRMINITDLGAGSQLNNDKKRAVSVIAKNELKLPEPAQLLYRLAADLQPSNIIELGTSLGVTSVYFKKAAPDVMLYTLEGCPETAEVARETLAKAGINNYELIIGDFDNTLPRLLDHTDKVDLVFVDGNHTKEATLRYFEWLLPKVHDGTLLIFDDIYWSAGMKEAWKAIKAHPQVTVTIDLFFVGLVYFKKGQAKEDFLIKF